MKSTRRSFARLAVTTAALAPLVPSALAQTPPAPTPPPTAAAATGGANDNKTQQAPPNRFAEAQTMMVAAQFGVFLDDAEMARVRKDFEDSIPFVERLRNYPLTNADEPDCSFSAVEGGEHDA